MDFFRRQNIARRKTGVLVVYFIAAIVAITLMVNFIVYLIAGYGGYIGNGLNVIAHAPLSNWIDGPHWIWTTALVLIVIGLGSLISFVRLAEGGRAVARMLDARPVDLNSTDPRIKRLVNVVEEMAIASGTPVPDIYIQDGERGINACVAGYEIRQAVLVVTEGALAELNRDELQGVIGHEFSHILNGDMRINVRLIAILAGVMLIAQIGGFLLRSSGFRRTTNWGARYSGKSNAIMCAIGCVLYLLGYLGLMFGRLIKAAITRQREFLADASSVQFTRNPDGIATALYKIQQAKAGSYLSHSHAEDMSHMCFGETVRYRFSSWYATHPPIDERIEAIRPGFVPPKATGNGGAKKKHTAPPDSDRAGEDGVSPEQVFKTVVTSQILIDSVGNPSPQHFDYARQIRAGISELVTELVHEPLGARAVIYALILVDAEKDAQAGLKTIIAQRDGGETVSTIDQLLGQIEPLSPCSRFALVELAFPALGRLHIDQKHALIETLKQIIKGDHRYSLYEFSLLTLVRKHLIDAGERPAGEFKSFAAVGDSLRTLVSLFAQLGVDNDSQRQQLYSRVIRTFSLQSVDDRMPVASAQQLGSCLEQLDRLIPMLKRPVLNACADCVVHDGHITPKELELLRATSVALDCPMPPLLPG